MMTESAASTKFISLCDTQELVAKIKERAEAAEHVALVTQAQ